MTVVKSTCCTCRSSHGCWKVNLVESGLEFSVIVIIGSWLYRYE